MSEGRARIWLLVVGCELFVKKIFLSLVFGTKRQTDFDQW